MDEKSNHAQTMKFSILLLLTLGFNACPALAQEGKDHNERALSAPIKGPLRQSRNPNYFEDASGTPLILCGSQTWNTLQDWGSKGAVRPLDFDDFVSFLRAHGHNFTLLWCNWTVEGSCRFGQLNDVRIGAKSGADFGGQEFLEDCRLG